MGKKGLYLELVIFIIVIFIGSLLIIAHSTTLGYILCFIGGFMTGRTLAKINLNNKDK
jgi:hypothetical protein